MTWPLEISMYAKLTCDGGRRPGWKFPLRPRYGFPAALFFFAVSSLCCSGCEGRFLAVFDLRTAAGVRTVDWLSIVYDSNVLTFDLTLTNQCKMNLQPETEIMSVGKLYDWFMSNIKFQARDVSQKYEIRYFEFRRRIALSVAWFAIVLQPSRRSCVVIHTNVCCVACCCHCIVIVSSTHPHTSEWPFAHAHTSSEQISVQAKMTRPANYFNLIPRWWVIRLRAWILDAWYFLAD